jgi:hypothetical protein
LGSKILLGYEEAIWPKELEMPVKFGQMIVRFWFFLSYLITTVLSMVQITPKLLLGGNEKKNLLNT